MAAPPNADSIALLDRFVAALVARGVVTEAEIQERIARTDRASPEIGARMVARAWTDPDYRALMLRDGTAAAEAAGVSMAGMPPLGVLEDTDSVHHLVVCTLCSCYPRAVLGYPPHWYKSAAYRARAVRDPRGVHGAGGQHRDPRGGQHGGLPLDGAAAAPQGHRGLGCGAAGRPRDRRRAGRRRAAARGVM
jgi:hypothetical protein